MINHRLAHRYAKSIIDLSIERNQLELIYKDFYLLNSAIDSSRDLELMLHSPIIHTDKKQKVLELIFIDKINSITMDFIKIILRKKREMYLFSIAKAFIAQYEVIKKIEHVALTTASPVNPDLTQRISDEMKAALNMEKIDLQQRIDEDIIGGFKLTFENKQIDASIKYQLDLLEKEFKA